MTKFKVGDRVVLRKDSRFANQSDVPGTVTKERIIVEGEQWYSVEWDHGDEDGYCDYDLKLLKKKSSKLSKIKEELLK